MKKKKDEEEKLGEKSNDDGERDGWRRGVLICAAAGRPECLWKVTI